MNLQNGGRVQDGTAFHSVDNRGCCESCEKRCGSGEGEEGVGAGGEEHRTLLSRLFRGEGSDEGHTAPPLELVDERQVECLLHLQKEDVHRCRFWSGCPTFFYK